MNRNASLFTLDGTPKPAQILALALQHVVAMIAGCVTVPLLVSNASGISPADSIALIQACLFCSGISILLQVLPWFKGIGAKLPLITGASFVFLPAYMAIGKEFGLGTVFGGQLVGGICAVLFGFLLTKIHSLFPPIVTGTIITTIGLSLCTTAINYMAGGEGSTNYGSVQNWILALLTMVIVFVCTHFGKGFLKLASILIGIVVGYGIALALNMIDFQSVAGASWVQTPMPLHFGMEFEFSAVLTIVFVSLVQSIEVIGDITSTTTGGLERQPETQELRGGIIANGIISGVGSLFGGIAMGTYSQNVGIVITTKTVNRKIFITAGGIVILAGLIPKLSALFTTIPQCVLGGAVVAVFGSITMTGIRLIAQQEMNGRNMAIVGLAIIIGMGVVLAPQSLVGLPVWLRTLFGTSAVVLSGTISTILNLILPEAEGEKELSKRGE